MHILYLCQYFTPPDAVGGTRAYEMAKRMARKGHSVHVITSSASFPTSQRFDRLITSLTIEGIDVEVIRVGYSNYMSIPRRIIAFFQFAVMSSSRAARSLRPDVILATSTPLTIALPALVARLRFNAPLVFEVRDLVVAAAIEGGYLRNPILKWLVTRFEDLVYRISARIVALSPSMRDAIVQQGVPATKIAVIPNCCDPELLDRTEREDARRRLDLKGDFICLYAGSMGPIYGVASLIDTAVALRQGGSRARIVLLGDGTDRPMLARRITELGLDNIELRPPVPKNAMALWFAACDIGLAVARDVPVLHTCSPNKFFDILAAGRGVVMTYGGWMAELLSNCEAGIDLPPERPDLLAATLMELEADAVRVARMGKNAFRLGMARFGRERLAQDLIGVLETVALGAPPNC